MAIVASDPLGRHDLDLNGPSFASLVFITALFLLVMILIFMVLVLIASEPSCCGFGYNYWVIFLVVALVATTGDFLGCGLDYRCW